MNWKSPESRANSLKNLKPVKKGEVKNPHGRPPIPRELLAIQRLTHEELIDIGNLVIKGDVEALKAVCRDPHETVIRVMVASVAVKVIQKGDMHALDVLLNRLIGKVPDKIQHSGIPAAPSAKIVVQLPSNGREAKKE